jgi:hypothetical protein
MACKEFFRADKVGVEDLGFAVAGCEEEFCGWDEEDLGASRTVISLELSSAVWMQHSG